MKKTKTTVTLTDTDIRLFQAEMTQGKGTVTFCDIRSVVSCSDDDIAALFKDMVAFLPVSPEEILFLVPRRSVVLKQMTFPSRDPDEIEDMLGLQLVNNIPYPIGDVSYRHVVLDRDDDDNSRVLAMIIHKNVSLRYCRILQKAGVNNGKLVLNSFGLSGWFAYQQRASAAGDHHPAMVVNVNSGYSEICFCRGKDLFFSRSIPYGEEHLLSMDIAELDDQVRLSLESYQRERLGPEVRKMLILSTAKGRTILKERFEEELGLPVTIFNPSDNIFCAPSMNKSVLRACRPTSITAEIGLLLSETKGLVNLTPGEVYEAKQKRKEKRRVVKCVALLLIAAALGISGQLVDIYKKGRSLETLKGEIARLQPRLEEARRKQRSIAFFDQKFGNYSFIPDLIDELTRLTPEEISFRTLSLNEERGLTIQGYAETHAGINDFQARLIRSERFHDVDLKFATKRKIAKMSVMDFKIVSRLNGYQEGGL